MKNPKNPKKTKKNPGGLGCISENPGFFPTLNSTILIPICIGTHFRNINIALNKVINANISFCYLFLQEWWEESQGWTWHHRCSSGWAPHRSNTCPELHTPRSRQCQVIISANLTNRIVLKCLLKELATLILIITFLFSVVSSFFLISTQGYILCKILW